MVQPGKWYMKKRSILTPLKSKESSREVDTWKIGSISAERRGCHCHLGTELGLEPRLGQVPDEPEPVQGELVEWGGEVEVPRVGQEVAVAEPAQPAPVHQHHLNQVPLPPALKKDEGGWGTGMPVRSMSLEKAAAAAAKAATLSSRPLQSAGRASRRHSRQGLTKSPTRLTYEPTTGVGEEGLLAVKGTGKVGIVTGPGVFPI